MNTWLCKHRFSFRVLNVPPSTSWRNIFWAVMMFYSTCSIKSKHYISATDHHILWAPLSRSVLTVDCIHAMFLKFLKLCYNKLELHSRVTLLENQNKQVKNGCTLEIVRLKLPRDLRLLWLPRLYEHLKSRWCVCSSILPHLHWSDCFFFTPAIIIFNPLYFRFP